jgi:hypothetical protein
MSIPPESIQVGQCYLSETGKVCRVTGVLPDQRVQFAWRNAASRRMGWRREVGIMSVADSPVALSIRSHVIGWWRATRPPMPVPPATVKVGQCY